LLLDLRRYGRDLHRYLRWIETLLVAPLAHYGIEATTRAGLTGVWVENRKIASIGVGVRHWITMHGFALNVSGDLAPFKHITPCGIADVTMTSIEQETGKAHAVKDITEEIARLTKLRVADLTGSAGRRPVGAGSLPARAFGTAAG
jgi:lipoyl(octanoyl) transferase